MARPYSYCTKEDISIQYEGCLDVGDEGGQQKFTAWTVDCIQVGPLGYAYCCHSNGKIIGWWRICLMSYGAKGASCKGPCCNPHILDAWKSNEPYSDGQSQELSQLIHTMRGPSSLLDLRTRRKFTAANKLLGKQICLLHNPLQDLICDEQTEEFQWRLVHHVAYSMHPGCPMNSGIS